MRHAYRSGNDETLKGVLNLFLRGPVIYYVVTYFTLERNDLEKLRKL